jgi:WD40 repeat protein/tRNA A-37 threonylcarbamoyl transferase component Bud32
MSADDAFLDADRAEDAELVRLLDACLADIEAGRGVDLERLAAEHPAQAGRVRACLAGLQAVEQERATMDRAVADGAPQPARRRLGDYLLLREVGRGGMGIVYEAEQVSLGRRVAVKVLSFASALDPRLLQRFHNEARAAAGLRHAHIVPVYAVGCEDGVHFYVMQYVEGRTLAALTQPDLAEAPTAVGGAPSPAPPPAPRSGRPVEVRLGVQAALALEHAHQLGVIHRDVKPANLLLDGAGHLWVTDFGLALLRQGDRLTRTGDVIGTLHYMAPEQTSAQRGLADHRVDAYGLGATLYELLTGQPVFDAPSRAELLRRILEDEPRPPRRLNRAVPADLETVVLKCLAKRPEERYASAQALADDLGRFLDDRPIQARRPGLAQRLGRWSGRNRWPLIGVATFLALTVAAGAASAPFLWRAKRDAETALAERTAALEREQDARRRERSAATRDRLSLAQREWEAKHLPQALRLLDACPTESRAWEWHYLNRLCRGNLRSWPGGPDGAISMAVSPDGRQVVLGTTHGSARILDPVTGAEFHVRLGPDRADLRSPPPHVGPAAFSPDGAWLALADSLGRAAVYRKDGRPLRTLSVPPAAPYALAADRDGRLLATAGEHNTVVLRDVATGGAVRTLAGHSSAVGLLAFNRQGLRSLLASGGYDGRILVWDAATGERVLTLDGGPGGITTLAFSPDGRALWHASGTRRAVVVDLATGKDRFALEDRPAGQRWLAISPDNRHVVTGGVMQPLHLWDLTTGKRLRTLPSLAADLVGLAYTPDGRLLAAGADGQLHRIDLAVLPGPRSLTAHTQAVTAVAFAPSGGRLASVSKDGTVKTWDVATGEVTGTLPIPSARVAFSPDGRLLALAGADQTVTIRDVADLAVARSLRAAGLATDVTFSPDGQLIAAGIRATDHGGFPPAGLQIWDAATGQEVHKVWGERWGERWGEAAVRFSPDGRLLAWDPGGERVQVLDAMTRQVLFTCVGANNSTNLRFSPDSRQLAGASDDDDVALWDAVPDSARPERQPILRLKGHTRYVCRVAFSPDGRRLASTEYDGTVKVWDPAAEAEVLTLKGASGSLEAIEFSPDGRLLAAACGNGAVLLWDARPLEVAPGD